MNEPQLPEGVGLTALFTAYARAQESRRADRLFDDPQAAEFIAHALGLDRLTGSLPRLGPAREDGSSPLWNGLVAYFSSRTPFYDTYLAGQAQAGCRQLVLLGAGLDSRAFRLRLPAGTIVYEVDTPGVLDFKENVLTGLGAESGAERRAVKADLREDWGSALLAAGFDPRTPTAWLAEGLLMYLQPGEADVFVDRIRELSAPTSTLAGEYLNRRTRLADLALADDGDRAIAEIFVSADRGGPGSRPPADWLAAHGWDGAGPDLVDVLTSAGRPVPELFDPRKPDPLRVRMFTATRR
ncbi:SAM-dependent methyltransferase [Amycolatopsis sp. NPDC005232]|uniref:SAM-dependent methyltransferase n=1 Tax=Amycolatopsis sp. NPDC005232 TaxID=3157027 RepID=UPI0033A56696